MKNRTDTGRQNQIVKEGHMRLGKTRNSPDKQTDSSHTVRQTGHKINVDSQSKKPKHASMITKNITKDRKGLRNIIHIH